MDTAPYVAHSATSKAAARAIERKMGPLHSLVLTHITDTGGATDEQLCDALGLGGNTLRPRRRELEQMGRVRDSGRRAKTISGRNAVIWEAA